MKKRQIDGKFKIIIGIILIIVIAVLGENSIRFISKFSSEMKIKKQNDIIEKEYMKTDKYKVEKKIEEEIQQLITYYNEEKYNEIYDKMIPEYLEYRGVTSLEEFISIIKDFMMDVKEVNGLNCIQYSDSYICTVVFDSEHSSRRVEMLAKPSGDSYKFMLENLQSLKEYKLDSVEGDFKCTLNYKAKKSNEVSYIVTIVNDTDKDWVGTFEDTTLCNFKNIQFKPENKDELKNITVPANGSVRLRFYYVIRTNLSSPDDEESLVITLNCENEEILKSTISFGLEYL